MDHLRIPDAPGFRLAEFDPADTLGMKEDEACDVLERNRVRIAEIQNRLYAEKKQSLLVVLQSMDTGGKDPIIRDVLYTANPQACRVTAFKKADRNEAAHDRFWRFHQAAPVKGEIGVFNRAYYDDIIKERAHNEMSASDAARHYGHINHFEALLADQDIHIIKLFLHISKEEQRHRLQERIDNPERHWELSESDFKERRYWDGYMAAYEEAIRATETDCGHWFIITADRKWYRDAAASTVIADTLERMNPRFPPPKVDLSSIEWF
jgi:PPK2 family polyphosphate:nucleotide phosphotransferase